MVRRVYERRSLGVALTAYLVSQGWTTLTYSEGFSSQKTIKIPQLVVQIIAPSGPRPLQIGRLPGDEKLFLRRIQIDVYMESEQRADGILDDVMDFIDMYPVEIVDPDNNVIGSFICQDTLSIYGDTLPPATDNPKLLEWRGIVRAEMEAFYYPPPSSSLSLFTWGESEYGDGGEYL